MTTQKNESPFTGLEIAVIGMAGRFPGADNVKEFWANLKNGYESITFFRDEELIDAGVETDLLKNPSYIKAKGIISNPDCFDADFFEYTPSDAWIMDPQIRIFHECVWEALEDAGYDPYRYKGTIGLFAGASLNLNWLAVNIISASNGDVATVFNNSQLSNSDFITTLISYKLNLRGPSIVVKTACSTSLIAIHIACKELLTGGSKMALAGGVSIPYPQKNGYLYQEGLVMSPDGHCRAFDAQAKGIVSGEGAGVIVLKRLEDAIQDGDHIYALIKGSAANNDGSNKIGFTAPSINGQAQMLRAAYHFSEVSPETIGYIEAHGTGTALGDPVEIEALKAAFRTNKRNYCGIGSVKTNIGHLDTASGIASIIKTVLSLHHRQIPPSLHFVEPNPEIDLVNSPFYINRKLREWTSDGGPLRAGVNALGIGGTNVHVILEEAPAVEKSQPGRTWQLLLLSARTATALDRLSVNLVDYLENNSAVNLADVAYTLQVGRAQFRHRRMVLCSSVQSAINQLYMPNPTNFIEMEQRSVVFMFPGENYQFLDLGRDLYQKVPLFRQEMDRYLTMVNPLLPFNLKSFISKNIAGNDLDSNNPLFAQTILFIVEYALAQTLIKLGINPEVMIGDNIGEYIAACLSGVFSLEDALAMVVFRANLIRDLPSGTTNSEMIEQVLPEFIKKMKSIQFHRPRIPYISNLTGKCITMQDAVDPQYWVKHLQHTIRFTACLTELSRNKNSIFIEVGPKQTLGTYVKQNWDSTIPPAIINIIDEPKGQETYEMLFFKQLGQLWCMGIPVSWEVVYQFDQRRRLSLPSYPFERKYFGFKGNPFAMLKRMILSEPGKIYNHIAKEQAGSNRNEGLPNKLKLSKDYVAPQNEMEAFIAHIWADTLGLERISRNDNFFNLGGSSLHALRMIGRLAQSGFHLTVNQIFMGPTVREIAAILQKANNNQNQGAESGTNFEYQGFPNNGFHLSAVQRRFLQRKLVSHNIFNLPFITLLQVPLSIQALKTALESLLQKHDALRLTFGKTADQTWYQYYREFGVEEIFQLIDLGKEASQHDQFISNYCSQLQTGFDIEKGPLFRLILFNHYQGGPQQILFLLFHHLVTDGFSLQIFLQDIYQLLYSQSNTQPEIMNTTSYRDWCLSLHKYAKNNQFEDAYLYWKKVLTNGHSFFTDTISKIQPTHTQMVTVNRDIIDNTQEIDLLIKSSMKQQTQPLTILIAALSSAIYDLKKQSDTLFHMMSLQRESFLADTQIQRTIGFFAGAFPIRIQLEMNHFNTNDYQKIIAKVKQTLFEIPKEGLDYFVLKYLLPELREDVQSLEDASHMLFHHISLLTDTESNDGPNNLPISVGSTNSPDNVSSYLLNITTFLTKECLNMNCYYSSLHYQAETIQELMNLLTHHLKQIIAIDLEPNPKP